VFWHFAKFHHLVSSVYMYKLQKSKNLFKKIHPLRSFTLAICLSLVASLTGQIVIAPAAHASAASISLDNCISAINDPLYVRSTLPAIMSYTSAGGSLTSYANDIAIENAITAGTLKVWVATADGAFGGSANGAEMDLFCGDFHNNTVATLDAVAGKRDYFFGGSGNDTVTNMWESVFYGGPGDDQITNSFSEVSYFYGGPGTDSYNAVTKSTDSVFDQGVDKTSTTTTLSAASSTPVYGSVNTLTATVSSSSATGTVSFSSNSTPITGCSTVALNAGVATCAFTAPAVATYSTLAAVYSGDNAFSTSTSSNISITVSKASLTVTPANSTVTYGGTPSYSFSYSNFVNSDTASSSSFTTGLTPPTCSAATYTTTSSVSASPLSITCTGGSSTNYLFTVTATASLSITKANSTLSISLNPTPPVIDTVDTITATASVPGTVTFTNSGTTLCNAVATTLISPFTATCAWTPTLAGANSLTANLTPTASTNFNSASASSTTATEMSAAACSATITKGGVTFSASDVEITTNGMYCIAKFKTVGNDYAFTVPSSSTAIDYLIVGGGGGGASGGGGGGGVLSANDYVVTPNTVLTISVGAGGSGGAGGLALAQQGGQGGSSTFNSITAFGGGGGGSAGAGSTTSQNGASGGGSRFDCDTVPCQRWGTLGNAGTGIKDQGNNGGTATYSSYGAGGGGGGAGGPGFNTIQPHLGGNGGAGKASSITGSSTYYGGGGGGGVNQNGNVYVGFVSNSFVSNSATVLTNGGGIGGQGGGGRGSSYGYSSGTRGVNANATAGGANTGGGGGGVDPEDTGGKDGGSGVVIIRWVAAANQKTITFNNNFTPSQSTTQQISAGVSTKLSRNTLTRTGYLFNGWNSSANGSGQSYTDEQNVTLTSSQTLYAQWGAGVTNTVTFNANSGSGSMANQIASDSISLTINSFTKSNSRFTGWNTIANGSGFGYTDGAIYSFALDITMYAQWQTIVPTFTVTFYGNGADGGVTQSQSASASTALTLNGYARSGYNFLRWNTLYGNNGTPYLDGQAFPFTADTNLYAIWVVQTNNTLIFNGNDSDSGSTASQTASQNTLLNTNGYVKNLYTFKNWNTLADGTGVSYQSNYTYSFAAGLTLYAQWGRNITITYAANGADTGSVPSSQSTYVGSPGINLSANTGRLVRTGYRLAGWNTQADSLGTPYSLGASSINFMATTTLYAHWTISEYKIVYVGNGNEAGAAPAVQTANFGSTVVISDNAGGLARTGFEFSGWNTSPDGSGTTLLPLATDFVVRDNVPLYAKWSSLKSSSSNSGGGEPIANPQATSTNSIPTAPAAPTVSKPVEVVKPVVDVPQNRITSFTKTTKVYFGLNASWMNSQNIKNIRAFLAGVSKTGNIKEITIQGFTQPTRINPDPLGLSVARAKAVGKFVKSQGLVSRVITQGKGNAKDNNAKSRYVLVTVTGELIGN
jgi:uncharacterized repeat protein (TIGR02543 family)